MGIRSGESQRQTQIFSLIIWRSALGDNKIISAVLLVHFDRKVKNLTIYFYTCYDAKYPIKVFLDIYLILFIHLAAPELRCGMSDLVPWLVIEPGPLCIGNLEF